MANYFDSYDPTAYLTKRAQPQAPVATKQKFNATSLIPAAAAALSFIPGIGTVTSAALGAGGEALREKLNGENFDLGKIGTEGAISAVPFAAGRIAKVGVGAVKAAHGISAVEGVAKGAKAVANAGKAAKDAKAAIASGQLPSFISKASKAAPEIAQTAETAAGGSTLLDKVASRGNDLRGSARGITPGAKAAGQDQLGVEGSNELNDFLTSAGIKSGSAKTQLADLEAKHKVWGQQIGETITKNNRALAPSDVTNLKGRIGSRVDELVGLPKTGGGVALVGADGKAIIESPGVANHPYLSSLYQDLGNIHDLKSANAFRQKLDKDAINYGRNSNAPDPAKEQIAKAFRGGIDEYVSEQIPHLKSTQALYSKSADAQDFLKNAAKNPAGLSVPFFGRALGNFGGEEIQAGKMAVANAAEGAPGAKGGSTLFSKVKSGAGTVVGAGKALVGQEAARLGVAATGIPVPSIDNMTATVPDPNQAEAPLDTTGATEGAALGPAIDYNAEADKILNSGLDAKTQSAQLDLLAKRQAIEKAAGGSGKSSLNSTASGTLADGQSAIDELGKLAKSIGGGEGSTGPILGRLRSANPYDVEEQSLQAQINKTRQIVGKALEGGVLRKEDEEKYKKILPTTADTREVALAKIDYVMQQLKARQANYAGLVGGSSDAADYTSTIR